MGDSDNNDTYSSYITKTITDVKNNSKRPDEKAISDYVNKNFATNINESFIENIIKKLLDQNILENKPPCQGKSFFTVANKNSEDAINPEAILSQTPTPQTTEFRDTPQSRQEENSGGETYTKHNKITLANLTAKFMALNTFLIDELHSENKKYKHN